MSELCAVTHKKPQKRRGRKGIVNEPLENTMGEAMSLHDISVSGTLLDALHMQHSHIIEYLAFEQSGELVKGCVTCLLHGIRKNYGGSWQSFW